MLYSNNEEAKLLLCTCTKYYDDQKNGILFFAQMAIKLKIIFMILGIWKGY